MNSRPSTDWDLGSVCRFIFCHFKIYVGKKFMTTVNQLVRKPRKPKPYKTGVPALEGCPQKRGVCNTCLYNDAQKAELGIAQGRTCQADQRV